MPLRNSFRLAMAANNKAPRTIATYLDAVDKLGAFLVDHGMPQRVAAIRRDHVEAWQADLLAHGLKPASVSFYYRAAQQFFRFLEDEGEVEASPMARMRPPRVPEVPVPVLSEAEAERLLRACAGREFEAVRDRAIIMLLLDTGMRRAECTGLRVADVDPGEGVAIVLGKGRRPRGVPFGRRTALALDRYLRARGRHRDASRSEHWLGHGGPMTESGVYQVVRDRAAVAGLKIHPHQLRHTFAHHWLASGGNEVT